MCVCLNAIAGPELQRELRLLLVLTPKAVQSPRTPLGCAYHAGW